MRRHRILITLGWLLALLTFAVKDSVLDYLQRSANSLVAARSTILLEYAQMSNAQYSQHTSAELETTITGIGELLYPKNNVALGEHITENESATQSYETVDQNIDLLLSQCQYASDLIEALEEPTNNELGKLCREDGGLGLESQFIDPTKKNELMASSDLARYNFYESLDARCGVLAQEVGKIATAAEVRAQSKIDRNEKWSGRVTWLYYTLFIVNALFILWAKTRAEGIDVAVTG